MSGGRTRGKKAFETCLHSHKAVIHLDLLREEVRPDGRLVLVAELLVHVPTGGGETCFRGFPAMARTRGQLAEKLGALVHK